MTVDLEIRDGVWYLGFDLSQIKMNPNSLHFSHAIPSLTRDDKH